MKVGRFLAASAILTAGQLYIVTPQTARAADLLATPPHGAPAGVDWTGPSIGLNASNLWGTGAVDFPGFGKFDGFSLNGPSVGLTLGYDYQFAPGLIAGGAADFNVSNSQFTASTPGQSLTVREYASWALRGRVGTEIGSGTLAYGTVGFSELIGDASLDGAVNAGSGRQTFNGVVFGLGLETQFDANMFVRFEYLHGVYGRETFAGGAFGVTPSTDSARLTLVLRPDGAAPGSLRPVSTVNWNGFYVGGMGGWENSRASATVPNVASVSGIGGSGPAGAALVGFNWAGPSAVAGLEGEVSATTAKASASTSGGAGVQASLPYEIAARARFGAPVASNTMLYGTVGGVWTQANASAGVPGATLSRSKDYAGVQFGLGMETMLTPHIGARVEYLESRYAKQGAITPSSGKTQSGLIYKF